MLIETAQHYEGGPDYPQAEWDSQAGEWINVPTERDLSRYERDKDSYARITEQDRAEVDRLGQPVTDTELEHGLDRLRDRRSARWADLAGTVLGRPVTDDADWDMLAATLTRAAETGYPVANRLPDLARQTPLPARSALRELGDRVMTDCPAAIPDPPTPAQINQPLPPDPARARPAPPAVPPAAPRPGPGGPTR